MVDAILHSRPMPKSVYVSLLVYERKDEEFKTDTQVHSFVMEKIFPFQSLATAPHTSNEVWDEYTWEEWKTKNVREILGLELKRSTYLIVVNRRYSSWIYTYTTEVINICFEHLFILFFSQKQTFSWRKQTFFLFNNINRVRWKAL